MNNIRSNRERGAVALYAGKSEEEAMAEAGLVYSPANARRFRNSRDVRDRLREMFEADRRFFHADAQRAISEAMTDFLSALDSLSSVLQSDSRRLVGCRSRSNTVRRLARSRAVA